MEYSNLLFSLEAKQTKEKETRIFACQENATEL